MYFLFSDGSDLDGVERVQDIKYMRILRWYLQFLGAWPGKVLGELKHKYYAYLRLYAFLLNVVCLPPGLLYIRNNFGAIDFLELGHTYVTVFINLFALLRLVLIFLKRYDNIMEDFVFKIHLFNHRERSDDAMSTHIFIHKVSHFFTMYINVMMMIGILLFNGTPLYNNVSSGAFANYKTENVTFQHSVYFELPFDYKHNFRNYWTIFLFNWVMSICCSSCFCIFDLLMSLMVFHICGHLRILSNSFESLRRPKKRYMYNNTEYEWFTADEMRLVINDLRNIVLHHNLIIRFTARMKKTFGPVLALYYVFHLVNGCILLLECSQMNPEALVRYGTLTFIVFQQLIQISIVFELIGIMSGKLVKAVYSVPWECMNVSGRKMVYIILVNTQKSMSIRAIDMVDVGVQTMVKIIKTSVSYFIMLRTFAES